VDAERDDRARALDVYFSTLPCHGLVATGVVHPLHVVTADEEVGDGLGFANTG
jgi:hypothetical protein